MKRASWVPLLGLLALAGCRAAPQVVGLVSGALVGAATANPAAGIGVAVATDAATDAGIKYYGRARARAEQDEIAAAAGPLSPGGQTNWRIRHTIPIGNEHGTLQVMRDIINPIATCKEIAFSVLSGPTSVWYNADICLQDSKWKWASAEPAVERWGNLQ